MHITDYHAQYFANELTLQNVVGVDRLSRALFYLDSGGMNEMHDQTVLEIF